MLFDALAGITVNDQTAMQDMILDVFDTVMLMMVTPQKIEEARETIKVGVSMMNEHQIDALLKDPAMIAAVLDTNPEWKDLAEEFWKRQGELTERQRRPKLQRTKAYEWIAATTHMMLCGTGRTWL